jgi:[acyl-carrier-protein] S-malonyltransferase
MVIIMKALIFPGQGSQELGMGRELYDGYAEARAVFETGARVTGRDLTEVCGACGCDAETLNRTENAQLAVFTVSMAAYAVWRLENEAPAAMAGFSLGECSALCAAGVLSLEDGFRLVQKRAETMMAACKGMNGAMSALLGGDPPEAYEDGAEWAVPVNYNCPGQIVVAGTPEGVAVLERRCKDSGGRAARLAVSGAFHTKMMAPAAAALRAFAQGLAAGVPSVPVYTNLTGEPLPAGTGIPAHLERQMTNPVLWQRCVENMLSAGVTEFIETGHGTTLGKFIKRIRR